MAYRVIFYIIALMLREAFSPAPVFFCAAAFSRLDLSHIWEGRRRELSFVRALRGALLFFSFFYSFGRLMISFPLSFVSRALSFLRSFRIPSFSVRTARFRSVPYLFSFLRFWLLACLAALFVSCAGGGGGGGGGSSDSRPPFELVDPFISGTDGGYLEFRSPAIFSFNVTCPPFCEEREVLFFRSSTAKISLQDDEIGRENVSLNVSDTQRLSFPFAAGLPGIYYYGVCIGVECSVAEEIIVAGLAVTSLVTNAPRREGTDGDVFFVVENDDELQLRATVSCFGPAACPDINVSYYRAIGDGMAEPLGTRNLSAPLRNMTEALLPPIDDTVDYTGDTRYYACLDPAMPSREISYGEDSGSCSTVVVRLDDDDGDGVSRRNDVDEDGDGLVEIGTAAELDAMRYVLDGNGIQVNATAAADMRGCPPAGCRGYELTADIDLAFYSDGRGWEPIGDDTAPFVADFSGNNFTIRNLYINRSAENGVGLFGQVGAGAELKDVRLAAVDVSGRNNVGGLLGDGTGATIIASSVTGMVNGRSSVGGLVGDGTGATIIASSVMGMVNGENSVGGLVGDGTGATIIASSVTGMVNGTDSVGGLVGDGENVMMTDSYSAGDVSGRNSVGGLVGAGENAMMTSSYATGTVSGRNIIGGLVGLGANAMMTASYAAGDVSGTDGVGGLVGLGANATISDSYSAGNVSGTNSVGGLVGLGANATMTASYVHGAVSGNNQVGGLVGDGTGTTIIVSYWDSNVGGQGLAGFGEPRSTLQLQVPEEELRTAWEGQLCPGSTERGVGFW